MRKIILLLMISAVYHGEALAGPKKYKYRRDYDHYFKFQKIREALFWVRL